MEPVIEIEFDKYTEEYSVNYQIEVEGNLIEITGGINSYHTGRCIEYEFEPDNFTDEKEEKYYDENFEEIENQIIDKFYEIKNK